MVYILFFAALFASGPGAEQPRSFDSLDECESAAARTRIVIQQWNAKEKDNIIAFALACVPVEAAKQGLGV